MPSIKIWKWGKLQGPNSAIIRVERMGHVLWVQKSWAHFGTNVKHHLPTHSLPRFNRKPTIPVTLGTDSSKAGRGWGGAILLSSSWQAPTSPQPNPMGVLGFRGQLVLLRKFSPFGTTDSIPPANPVAFHFLLLRSIRPPPPQMHVPRGPRQS